MWVLPKNLNSDIDFKESEFSLLDKGKVKTIKLWIRNCKKNPWIKGILDRSLYFSRGEKVE